MKRTYSEDVLKYLQGIDGICEANSFETMSLWDDYTKKYNYTWKETGYGGYLLTVGFIKKHPICISVSKAIVRGKTILFWDASSLLVDHRKIDKFFKKYLPGVPRTNAMNFHNVTS